MSASTKLLRSETRLFLREPMAIIFGLIFAPGILLAMGLLFPGFDEPLPDLGGTRLIDIWAPTAIGLALAMLALMMLPTALVSYRHIGVLRRLRTTPVHPAKLLLAQVGANVAVGLVGSAATVAVAGLVLDVPWPKSWGWLVLSLLLGMAAMFGLGVMISALSKSPAVGQVFGFALFFPMLFFAGVYVPRPMMSDGLLAASNYTPLGAAVQAMTDAWGGTTPDLLHVGVMVAYALVFTLVGVRFFRWE